MLKVDELMNINEELLEEIEIEEIKEIEIMNKRIESKYIIEYIKLFEQFEDIFMGEVVKYEKIKALYDAINSEIRTSRQEYGSNDIINYRKLS